MSAKKNQKVVFDLSLLNDLMKSGARFLNAWAENEEIGTARLKKEDAAIQELTESLKTGILDKLTAPQAVKVDGPETEDLKALFGHKQ